MTIIEVAVALVVLVAAMAALVQLVGLATRQRRAIHERAAALTEVANQAERLALLPWDEVAPAKLTTWEPSPELAAALPNAKCQAIVTEESEPPSSRRIELRVTWQNAAGQEVEPALLDHLEIPPGGPAMNASRRGKTLIEVVVIVALTGVALSLATTTLVTLFRVERQLRADTAYDLTQSRLATRWRTTSMPPSLPRQMVIASSPSPTAGPSTTNSCHPRFIAKFAAATKSNIATPSSFPAQRKFRFQHTTDADGRVIRLSITSLSAARPGPCYARATADHCRRPQPPSAARQPGGPAMTPISRRRGAALIVALTTLLVVMLIAAAVTRSLLASHRQAHLRQNELQAAWLAESAVSRALAQLTRRPEYTGETWSADLNPANPGTADATGLAEIRIRRSNPSPQA